MKTRYVPACLHGSTVKLLPTRSLAGLALATLLAAGSVQAGVVTLTPISFNSLTGSAVNYPALSFAKFDTSLGTLTSVTLNWVVNSSIASYKITNNDAGTVTLESLAFTRTFTAKQGSTNVISGDYTTSDTALNLDPHVALLQGVQQVFSNISFDQLTYSNTLVSSIGAYAGTGNVSLTLNNSFSAIQYLTGGGGQDANWSQQYSGSANGTLGVTYNYDAPVTGVPEPSNVLLCAAPALLGCGVFVRRLRKNRKGLL